MAMLLQLEALEADELTAVVLSVALSAVLVTTMLTQHDDGGKAVGADGDSGDGGDSAGAGVHWWRS